jgi:hypothetical protein
MLTPAEPGTYVNNWWGTYAVARATIIAKEIGAPIAPDIIAIAHQDLASTPDNIHAGPSITLEQSELMEEALEEAETWLNQTRALPEHYWGWAEGDWGHWPIDDPDQLP